MDTISRVDARAKRRRHAENVGAVLAGLAGILCLFAGPTLGGKMQMPLIVVGAALIAGEMVWIAQRGADDRTERQTDRLVEAQRTAAAAICAAVDNLHAAMAAGTTALGDDMIGHFAVLRRRLADAVAEHAVDEWPSEQPFAAPRPGPLWVPERPVVDDPTTEQPAVQDAPEDMPGPVRDSLDPGWRWTGTEQQEHAG